MGLELAVGGSEQAQRPVTAAPVPEEGSYLRLIDLCIKADRLVGFGVGVSGRERFEWNHQFLGGLVFKAHRLVYHSTLGLRVIKKKKKKKGWVCRYRRKEVVCRVRSPPDVPLTPATNIRLSGSEEGSYLRLIDLWLR